MEIDQNQEDSKTWNISKDFTHELVLQNLIEIKKYRTLAIFGYTELKHDIFVQDENLRSTGRISAFQRLTDSIKALIYFTSFDIKKPEHQKDFENYINRLRKIEKHVHRLRVEVKKGKKVQTIRINEELFSPMMVELSEMITKIISILNIAGFIFKRQEVKDFSRSVVDM